MEANIVQRQFLDNLIIDMELNKANSHKLRDRGSGLINHHASETYGFQTIEGLSVGRSVGPPVRLAFYCIAEI